MDFQTSHGQTQQLNDQNIGREWNATYGRQKVTGVIETGCGNLYVVSTLIHGGERRYSVKGLEDVIKRDEYRLTPEYQKELASRAAQAERAEQHRLVAEKETVRFDEMLSLFTAAAKYTPMRAGQAKKALSKQWRYEGSVLTLAELVKQLVVKGRTPHVAEEDRIKPMSRMAYHRTDNGEQRAHERKVESAGKQSVYELCSSDGRSLNVGAFGYAYAVYLIGMTTAQASQECTTSET